ncbi:NHLP bacteriocin system secretion protein [Magnetococcales bacterium HHB-1]
MARKQNNQIFRKEALERLASPEQLDYLVTTTDPKGWLALLVLALILTAIIAWSILGSIPTHVQGKGILVKWGGYMVDATAPAAGTLDHLKVKRRQNVEQGQVVATIRQTELQQQTQHTQETLKEQADELMRVEKYYQKDHALRLRNLAQRQSALKKIQQESSRRIVHLKKELKQSTALVKKGFMASRQLEKIKVKLSEARQKNAETTTQQLRLENEEIEWKGERDRTLEQLRQKVNQTRRTLKEQQQKLSEHTAITAPVSGVVIEIRTAKNSLLKKGDPVITIESQGKRIEAVAFLPTAMGRRVKAGMSARITPDTVKREEFGSLSGEVIEISDFPATSQGIRTAIHNEALIAWFSKQGPPYIARLALEPDHQNVSGYRWTTGDGPDNPLTSGVTVETEIVVRKQAPITLALPMLRKLSGINW